MSNNLLVGAVGGVGTSLGLMGLVLPFRHQLLHGIDLGLFLLYAIAVPSAYFTAFVRRLALGVGRIPLYNLPDLIEGTGLLIGTAAVVLALHGSLVPLVALRVGIEIAISLLLFVCLRRAIRFRFAPSKKMLRRQLAYGLRNYASALLWVVLLQSDLVLCNAFLGSRLTGIYSVAVSLSLPLTLLASVVGALVFQRVSSEESRPRRVFNTNRVMRVLLVVGAACALLLSLLAHWIVPLVYGAQFRSASAALILLLPGVFFLALETVLMNFFAGEGSPRIVYLAPLVGLALNFVANLFAIPRWGINGAAITSSAAYVLVFLFALNSYLRSTNSRLAEVFVRPQTSPESGNPPVRLRSPRRVPFRGVSAAMAAASVIMSLTAAYMIAMGQGLALLGLAALAGVSLVGILGERALVVVLVVATLLQPPLGDIVLPELQLAEVVVPILLVATLLRMTSIERRQAEPSSARLVHAAIAFYALVIVANVVRSKWLLPAVIPAGVNRTFYGYFVGLGVYALVYLILTRRPLFNTLFHVILILATLMTMIGIGAAVAHVPLNFGNLRYSVYDYSTGATRVGFLETFGITGLALVITRPMRFRLILGLLFATGLIISGGRSAAIGALVATVAYTLIARRGRAVIAVAVLIAMFALTIPSVRTLPQVQRLTQINQKEFASDGRLLIYGESYRAFRKHPVFGTGVGVPAVVASDDRRVSAFYEEQLEIGGHGTYAALLKNFGLSGLVPFAIALLATLWGLATSMHRSPVSGFFFILLIAEAVSAIAGGRGDDPVYYLALGGAAAWLASRARESQAAERSPSRSSLEESLAPTPC